MRASLGARDKRVLAIGASVCLTLVVAARGVPALRGWTRDARASAAQLAAEMANAQRSLVRAKETHDSLKARGARYFALGPRLLDGKTAAGGGGALASLVSDAAAEANLRLGSIQVRQDSAGASAFTLVAVRADLTGDIGGIAAMLATLERGPALLAVRELSITQPEPAAGDDRPEALRVALLVEGIMLTPKEEARR